MGGEAFKFVFSSSRVDALNPIDSNQQDISNLICDAPELPRIAQTSLRG